MINTSGFHDDMDIFRFTMLLTEPGYYRADSINIILKLSGFNSAFYAFAQQAQTQRFLADINT